MKRIVLWALSTASVLVLLFGYSTSTSGPLATSAASSYVSGSGAQPGTGGTTLTGDVAQTRWGPVQVELTLAGDSITDVSVLQYPNGNGRDVEINNAALPILIQETIDAQDADIDVVSGATVTSDGYRESLQSALDQQ